MHFQFGVKMDAEILCYRNYLTTSDSHASYSSMCGLSTGKWSADKVFGIVLMSGYGK